MKCLQSKNEFIFIISESEINNVPDIQHSLLKTSCKAAGIAFTTKTKFFSVTFKVTLDTYFVIMIVEPMSDDIITIQFIASLLPEEEALNVLDSASRMFHEEPPATAFPKADVFVRMLQTASQFVCDNTDLDNVEDDCANDYKKFSSTWCVYETLDSASKDACMDITSDIIKYKNNYYAKSFSSEFCKGRSCVSDSVLYEHGDVLCDAKTLMKIYS